MVIDHKFAEILAWKFKPYPTSQITLQQQQMLQQQQLQLAIQQHEEHTQQQNIQSHQQMYFMSHPNTQQQQDQQPNNKTHIENYQTNMSRFQSNNRFCHYFVNFGKCEYEERNGTKCKFIHRMSPMCKNGINCNRSKCMYTHPKPHLPKHLYQVIQQL